MAVHGKNTHVAIKTVAGVKTTVREHLRDASRSTSLDTAETTNFGQAAKTYVVGLSDSTMSVSGTFDKDFDKIICDLMDAMAAGTINSTEVEYGPAGNVTGQPLFTAQYIITSYDVSGSTGDVVTASIEFQRTGTTVRTVAA